ncbi:MAG: hypothetical protein DSZ07_05730 [Sulfurovum sp.]|nr:MAG: hypothetical protein DSZ07_05730 [Sulfurovum sp.]
MNLTAKSNTKLLIHKKMKPIISLENSIDIILTPQFYTFIREELDVKFSYQAKQIAGSLFDDYLDQNKEYQYHVYKCDNLWCFFAYNIEEIDLFLKSVGIEKHRVSKIYFIQQVVDKLDNPILLDEYTIIQNIDGVATLVPIQIMDSNIEYNSLNINTLKLKGGVTMGSSLNSYVSLKETILLSSIFCLLGGISIFEAERIKHSIANDNAKLIELLDENPSYNSSLARESILEKYAPIDKIERKKRQAVKDISKFLSNKSQLKMLTIDKNKIQANIKTTNRTTSQQIKENAINKKFKVIGSSLDLKVEKTL